MPAGHLNSVSGMDRDSDGFIDHTKFYAFVSEGLQLFLRNWKGRRFSDASRCWNPMRAIKDGDGFQVLVQGKATKKGLFSIFDVNSAGRINGKSKWRNQGFALIKGWENYLGDVIQVDGVIGEEKDADADGFLDGGTGYRMVTDDGFIPLKDVSGKAITNKSSKHWDAVRAVDVESGFQVLLRPQRGSKPSRFRLLDVDLDGTATGKSRWQTASKALFAGWDIRF